MFYIAIRKCILEYRKMNKSQSTLRVTTHWHLSFNSIHTLYSYKNAFLFIENVHRNSVSTNRDFYYGLSTVYIILTVSHRLNIIHLSVRVGPLQSRSFREMFLPVACTECNLCLLVGTLIRLNDTND